MSVTVTVGRNVKGVPMSTEQWEAFTTQVEWVFRSGGYPVYFRGFGRGTSQDWGVEDAFTLVAEAPVAVALRIDLNDALGKLGRYYGQEAVAVTYGPTHFFPEEDQHEADLGW